MKEALFTAGSVFLLILISSAIAFNPLTVRAQERLSSPKVPASTIYSQPLRPASSAVAVIYGETAPEDKSPDTYPEEVALV